MELCGAVRNCDIAVEVLEAAGAPVNRALQDALEEAKIARARATSRSGFKHLDSSWRSWLHAKNRQESERQTRAPPGCRPLEREYLKAGCERRTPGDKSGKAA